MIPIGITSTDISPRRVKKHQWGECELYQSGLSLHTQLTHTQKHKAFYLNKDFSFLSKMCTVKLQPVKDDYQKFVEQVLIQLYQEIFHSVPTFLYCQLLNVC